MTQAEIETALVTLRKQTSEIGAQQEVQRRHWRRHGFLIEGICILIVIAALVLGPGMPRFVDLLLAALLLHLIGYAFLVAGGWTIAARLRGKT
jgi:hypothetical protein